MANSVSRGLLPEAEKAFLAGNLARAEKWCSLHLASQPSDLDAKVLLAAVCAKTRRPGQAVELLREVLAVRPNYEAHLTLSTVLFFQGEVAAALEHAEQAIQLEPRELATYNKVGQELVRLGKFDKAIEFFRRAVEYAPEDLASNQNLAAALKDAGQLKESLAAWQRVTEMAPSFAAGWLNLGMLYLASHDYDSAMVAAERAIACDPKNVDAIMLAGLGYSEKGQAVEAEPYFRRVLELDRSHPLAQASLGVVLQEQGKFDESSRWLKDSLSRWQTNGLAYYVMVRSQKMQSTDAPFLNSIRSLLQRSDIGLLDRSYMEYALGKASEDLRDFEASIGHFDRANEAAYEFWFSAQPWDVERYRSTVDGTVKSLTQEKIADLRNPGFSSEKPVLIVGMIRSGTSLVEQILSSHPDVIGAGELPYWHEGAGDCFNPHTGVIDSEKLNALASGYLQLLDRFGPNARRVTDKMPHNYALLGLIQPAMPSARIVHIRRNPLDNCLSVYTTGYSRPPGFTLKRQNIVFAYRQYQRLMAHWRTVLSADQFLEIDYEDLVSHREIVTRRLVDFVGLEWDDRCLQHEQNKRSVHTPSAWQVRQPIYKTSVERWKNYEPWLREFRDLV